MATKTSPVTPAVLRWAISEDGRSDTNLADALKIDSKLLGSWMSGAASPTCGQVSDLARVLDRPRSLFFLPRPPETGTLPPSFRHPPGAERDVNAKVRRIVRQARRLQQAVSWALRDSKPVDLPVRPLNSAPAEAATVIRSWLRISDGDQAGWKNDYEALRAWRSALEDRDILAFALEIGRGEVRGFSSWDPHAPLIAMNTSGVAPAPRCFTLAHELGHLVVRQDAACLDLAEVTLAEIEIERWCEEFGAALLMPEQSVLALVYPRGLPRRTADLDDVREVTRRFRVSARAAALRLIDLNLAERSLYGEVLKVFVLKPREDGQPYSPPRATARLRQYGPRVISTVLEALPPRDALSVLRIDIEDVRRIAEEVPGVSVL
ncbi:MAG: ImmA/IrrE family metallo-endopeptidase [Pseudonocardiaceae bacterium]